MTDVLTQLRVADPVPSPVGYDDAVAQRNIEAIVRADLTVGSEVVPLRRPRRRAWLAVAAVAVLLAGAGVVVGVQAGRRPAAPPAVDATWTTFSADGITFEHPTEWVSYPYEVDSSFTSLITDLSTTPLPQPCTTTTNPNGYEVACSSAKPDLRRGGVLVDWTANGFPNWQLDQEPGVAATIDGHTARVDRNGMAGRCEGTGAVRSVQAAIERGATSNWLSMTACIGPGDVEGDLAAVDRMLASVRIDP